MALRGYIYSMKALTEKDIELIEGFQSRYPTAVSKFLGLAWQLLGLGFWIFVAYIFYRLSSSDF